ncbi:MAG: hypothetical protein JRI32_06025 [Deltaproteobacteria bacterium]|nr:hypothetical protein [Deltaproteobacteria bacterium]
MARPKTGKKRYNLYLTENTTEIVKGYFGKVGMPLSSFVDNILRELAQVIEGQPSPLFDKPISELTLKEFGELTKYWIGEIEDLDKK